MFEKILYPTDFSDVSKKALQSIKRLRTEGAKKVVVLHVIDKRSFDAVKAISADHALEMEREIFQGTEREMAAIEDELREVGYEVKTRIETGVPVQEILRVEQEEDVSVIVIGSHGKTNLEEIFLGSVSEKVVRKCKSPVLIVKR